MNSEENFVPEDEILDTIDDSEINEENNESQESNENKKHLTLEEKLEHAKTEVADHVDKLKRNLAEFDNFRKRTLKEKAGMYDDGKKDALEKFIPLVDTFELALGSVTNKDDNFYKGFDMIYKQFLTTLETQGITEIDALGKTFDPNLHDAVTHVDDEKYGDNEVILVMRKGYMYKDKILRHAMVSVAN